MSWTRPTLAGMARFSARCLLILGLLFVVGYVVQSLPLVFLSLFVALLLTTLLSPLAEWLARHRVPRSLASLAAELLGLALVGGVLAFVIPRAVERISAHADTLEVRAWNLAGSLTRLLPGEQASIEVLISRSERWIRQHAQELASGVVSGLSTLAMVLSGVLLTLVLAFFFVRDGRGMGRSALSLLPPEARPLARAALDKAWWTLSRWVRGTVLVALIDAVGIGVGLLVLGVPLALPLALLTFLGAFVPIIGAVVMGAVAVLVAWAMVGLKAALITVGIVLAVQQLEGNILQPMVMGRVLPLHPVVVLLAVTTGTLVAGVAGALSAVPLLAATTAGVQAFRAEARKLRQRNEKATEEGERRGDSPVLDPPLHS